MLQWALSEVDDVTLVNIGDKIIADPSSKAEDHLPDGDKEMNQDVSGRDPATRVAKDESGTSTSKALVKPTVSSQRLEWTSRKPGARDGVRNPRTLTVLGSLGP